MIRVGSELHFTLFLRGDVNVKWFNVRVRVWDFFLGFFLIEGSCPSVVNNPVRIGLT